MDEPRSLLPANLCEQPRRLGIQPHRLDAMVLAVIHLRQGGRVDQDIESSGREDGAQVVQLCQIELLMIEADHVAVGGVFARQRRAQPPPGAQHHNLQLGIHKIEKRKKSRAHQTQVVRTIKTP